MELSQLRSVVAIADTGNFSRAAERVNISQPSLSQQIINLEKEVGHKLFHRLGRKAVATEAGEVLVARARRILFEVGNVSKELADYESLERRITVGAIPTVAPYLLPRLIAKSRERYPHLQIDVREDFRSALIQGVVEGELDVAITSLPVTHPRISLEPLLREPLLLVVGKQHPFVAKAHVKAANLGSETFVMLGSSSSLAAQIQNFCGDRQLDPRIGFRCAQVATIKALVALGVGVSILPRSVQAHEDRKSLVYITLSDGAPTRELAIARHIQRYQNRGAEQFLGLLKEIVANPSIAPSD